MIASSVTMSNLIQGINEPNNSGAMRLQTAAKAFVTDDTKSDSWAYQSIDALQSSIGKAIATDDPKDDLKVLSYAVEPGENIKLFLPEWTQSAWCLAETPIN